MSSLALFSKISPLHNRFCPSGPLFFFFPTSPAFAITPSGRSPPPKLAQSGLVFFFLPKILLFPRFYFRRFHFTLKNDDSAFMALWYGPQRITVPVRLFFARPGFPPSLPETPPFPSQQNFQVLPSLFCRNDCISLCHFAISFFGFRLLPPSSTRFWRIRCSP